MNWQVLALVEALGSLRARLAFVSSERERERRNFAQKIEAAKDALARHEQNDGVRQQETERLKEELSCALKELAEARRLLELDAAPSAEPELGEAGA